MKRRTHLQVVLISAIFWVTLLFQSISGSEFFTSSAQQSTQQHPSNCIENDPAIDPFGDPDNDGFRNIEDACNCQPGPTTNMGCPIGANYIRYWEEINKILNDPQGDRWTFYATAGDIITIIMRSREFDTLLELYNPSGELLETNDDSHLRTDSVIDFYRIGVSGDYTIIARSYDMRQGEYTILIETGSTNPAYPANSTPLETPILTSPGTFVPSNSVSLPYLPISDDRELLPHNGLFIKRNNSYGTKLFDNVSLQIDQGALPEQDRLRLDEFALLSIDDVLFPENQAIQISYGLSEVNADFVRDTRTTHYLEIALRTPQHANPISVPETSTTAVNFMMVIDTSGSMSGTKLDAVKTGLRELYGQMRDTDSMGIIAFNTTAVTILELTPKSAIASDTFSQLISNLVADGSTDIRLGLDYGIAEFERIDTEEREINHIYLFSDGNPTTGITDWNRIRQTVSNQIRGKNVVISTYAFGADANKRELDALAGTNGGTSTFVINPSEIDLNITEDLARRDQLVALNIQLKVEIDEDIGIVHLYGHDEVTDPVTRASIEDAIPNSPIPTPAQNPVLDDDGIRIFVPNLANDETYIIVFELQIPQSQTSIGNLTSQYVDLMVNNNIATNIELTLEDSSLPTNLVHEHVLGLWTSEVIYYALDDLYVNELDTAKERINLHVEVLRSANRVLDSAQVRDDVITLGKFIALAENLGEERNFSDVSVSSPAGSFTYALNEFGWMRSGYIRR